MTISGVARVTTGWVLCFQTDDWFNGKFLRVVPMPEGWRENDRPYSIRYLPTIAGANKFSCKREAVAKAKELGELRPVRLFRRVRVSP